MPAPLEEVIASVLRIPAERVTDALEYDAVPEWDSMGHVGLMLALEGEYGIAISDETVLELTSVRAIRAYLAAHGSGSRSEMGA
ncbi:MAG TPA: acyl carrier protein [Gemmatimonadaceae bacterium]|nr:acyl carrier protein [Gemmatimonadaceae bacterium]